MRIFCSLYIAVAASCIAATPHHPYVGSLPGFPGYVDLDMSGKFAVARSGELELQLDTPCNVRRTGTSGFDVCPREFLDQIKVVAHASWGQDIEGAWADPERITFRIDWKATGLDPLMDNANVVLTRPWSVSGTQWNPAAADASSMLALIGAATDTEVDVVTGGPTPNLEVAEVAVDGAALRAGESNALVVRIVNHGPGTAYRVAATTRAGIEAMHGLRLSFGAIKPGAEKQRKVQFKIPASETAQDAMLVVSTTAANGASARSANRRIPITHSVAAPALGVECTLGGRSLTRVDVDAGQVVTLSCILANTGNADAMQVELETSVGTEAATRSAAQTIPASRRIPLQVPVTMPRALPIDSVIEIAITARDRVSSRSARITFNVVIRKPKLCIPGQLTHAQYRAKTAELRKAVSAGDITQAEFDRYDAALVSCLK